MIKLAALAIAGLLFLAAGALVRIIGSNLEDEAFEDELTAAADELAVGKISGLR
ncbi:MAG: hypothetical protein SOH60_08555 [Lachnospiraceae bacterium]|jgi:hypothetical protein